MKQMTGTVSFPVIFYDGEREIDIGNVDIHPSFELKKFQSILSQRIGISPHQISISLIKKSKSSGSRKVPVNEKVNFASIVVEKNCYFLVSLKRSRRGIKSRQNNNNYSYLLEENDYFSPKKVILRRGQDLINPSQFSLASSYYEPISSTESYYRGLGLIDYRNQIRNLQIQKDNYLMAINSYPYKEIEDEYVFGRIDNIDPKNTVVCEDCSSANGNQIPFHWCVYDAITTGFRSSAGPIQRPSKSST